MRDFCVPHPPTTFTHPSVVAHRRKQRMNTHADADAVVDKRFAQPHHTDAHYPSAISLCCQPNAYYGDLRHKKNAFIHISSAQPPSPPPPFAHFQHTNGPVTSACSHTCAIVKCLLSSRNLGHINFYMTGL